VFGVRFRVRVWSIFTKWLSSFSDAWASQYGVFSKADGWNSSVVRLLAQRNLGMADTVRRESFRIGYMTHNNRYIRGSWHYNY